MSCVWHEPKVGWKSSFTVFEFRRIFKETVLFRTWKWPQFTCFYYYCHIIILSHLGQQCAFTLGIHSWNLNLVGHRLVRSLLVNAIKRFVGSETCHNSPKSFQILLRHRTTCHTSEFYEPEASWHILLQRLELKKKMLVNHVKSYSWAVTSCKSFTFTGSCSRWF